MADLRELETWLPALELLVRDAPDGVDLVEYTGSVSTGSMSGSHIMDGANPPDDWRSDDEIGHSLFRTLIGVVRDSDRREVGVVLRASRSGLREVDLVELPDSVSSGVSDVVGDLLLVDGALPALFRRTPDLSVTARPADSADPDALARLVREKLPDAVGATDTQLDAVEARLGVPLTDEVRAIYRTAAAGELILGEDAGFYGMELIPLDDRANWDVYLPAERMSLWQFGASETLGPDPSGRIQTLAGSPTWFPVGHDWGGNVYAADLTPAENGYRGQVIFLDHEMNAGAVFVSRSFADLLVHGTEEEPTGPVERSGTAYVNARSGVTVAEAASRDELEVLNLGRLDQPADLTPVLDHPGLRTLRADPGTLDDPLQVGSLRALEYLSLGLPEWRILLDAGQVPRHLLAARVSGDDSDLPAVVATANELLSLWDRPLITATKLRQPTPPSAPAPPTPPSPPSSARPPEQGSFWSRLFNRRRPD